MTDTDTDTDYSCDDLSPSGCDGQAMSTNMEKSHQAIDILEKFYEQLVFADAEATIPLRFLACLFEVHRKAVVALLLVRPCLVGQ